MNRNDRFGPSFDAVLGLSSHWPAYPRSKVPSLAEPLKSRRSFCWIRQSRLQTVVELCAPLKVGGLPRSDRPWLLGSRGDGVRTTRCLLACGFGAVDRHDDSRKMTRRVQKEIDRDIRDFLRRRYPAVGAQLPESLVAELHVAAAG